ENNRNFSLVVRWVLNLLPYPLGFHVNLLVANGKGWESVDNSKKIELLKRQVITYNSLVQMLAFTLLSSFWNELKGNHNLKITKAQWKIIQNFLSTNHLNNQDVNYPVLLGTIREIFEMNPLKPFIEEYREIKKIFKDEDSFFETHLHMQGVKSSIANNE